MERRRVFDTMCVVLVFSRCWRKRTEKTTVEFCPLFTAHSHHQRHCPGPDCFLVSVVNAGTVQTSVEYRTTVDELAYYSSSLL
jgi:hypothetical protein